MGHSPAAEGADHRRWTGLLAALLVLLTLLSVGLASPARAADPRVILGTLLDGREPVPGATITAEQGGSEVGRTQTSETGAWRIEVPAAGTYVVRIDTETLPDDLDVRVAEREITFREDQSRIPVNFQVGAKAGEGDSRLDRAPQLLVGGFQYGIVLAMAALGLSLIFGTTGLTNFAHGELVTGGALAGWFFNVKVGMNLIPATVLAVGVGMLAGAALDRGLWAPLRRRGTGLIAALIVSIGLGFVLRYLYLFFFGGSTRAYEQYSTQDPVDLGPVGLLPRDMVIIAISMFALIGVGLALQRTRFGKATRAVADNPALAASSGIDVDRVVTIVWSIGTGLAVLGGVFLALSQQVSWELGQNVLLLLFAGITLGGLGTAYGALVGSMVIGLLTQLSTLYIAAELQTVVALVVLIVILIVRPQGILGSRERVG